MGFLTFVQSLGINGVWKQVRWNSTFDNGPGQIPGAYEEILWNAQTGRHTVVGAYDYTNTSLPPGDLEVVAKVNPELAMDGLGDQNGRMRTCTGMNPNPSPSASCTG